jgi:hypothetical protein
LDPWQLILCVFVAVTLLLMPSCQADFHPAKSGPNGDIKKKPRIKAKYEGQELDYSQEETI